MNTKTRWSVIAIAVAALFVFGFMIFWCYGWFLGRYSRMINGTASPTWPYADRSIEELNKFYPQYIENTAPTKQSPEQTHQLFVDALKRGDFDAAVSCCFREGDRARMKTGLEKIKQDGQLPTMIKDLDTKIYPNLVGISQSTYTYSSYRNGIKIGTTLNFIKTSDGIWYIESL